VISTRPNFITPVKIFFLGGGAPRKILWAKNVQNLARLWTTSKFGANISGMDENIKNRISTFCIAITPALGEGRSVNFGLLVTEIER